MFSLPRDTVDVPDPARPGPAASAGRVYGGKINSWFDQQPQPRRPLARATTRHARLQRRSRRSSASCTASTSSTSSRSTSTGFREVVDALGGVTINVQIPVVDDRYPGDGRHGSTRLYIPSGIQHMTGAEALRYARSRNTLERLRPRPRASSASSCRCASRPTRRPSSRGCRSSSTALKKAVQTDIPLDQLAELLGLASRDRHQEHPLVRVHAAALPAGDA